MTCFHKLLAAQRRAEESRESKREEKAERDWQDDSTACGSERERERERERGGGRDGETTRDTLSQVNVQCMSLCAMKLSAVPQWRVGTLITGLQCPPPPPLLPLPP